MKSRFVDATGRANPPTEDSPHGPTPVTRYDVLIVGGGHGGAQAAIALRQHGFTGTIAIISSEDDLPYERPPLSKDYLARKRDFARILIRPISFWTERHVDMLLGTRVVTVDPNRHRLVTHRGEKFGYDRLIWAAGGTPRRLSCDGYELTGIHTVRSRTDVDRIKVELETTERVAVIGGGYIGLEAAAVLTGLGQRVTVLEAQDRVLARVAAEPLSRFYEAEHRAHGVDIRLSIQVQCIEGVGGRMNAVRLTNGNSIPCDLAIVGIGIVPAVDPLLRAGADGDNGVLVDEHCRTTLPDIFAVGDCAAHRNDFADGVTVRLESVQNAVDQAIVAAKAIVGGAGGYRSVPSFWSDQYDLKLRTVGLSLGYDATVIRGDPETRSFSVIYLRRGRVIALDSVNSVKDFAQGRALVAARLIADPATLADSTTPLKQLLPAHMPTPI